VLCYCDGVRGARWPRGKSAKRLGGDSGRRAVQPDPRQGAADPVHYKLVLGAAEHYRPCVGGSRRSRGEHRRRDRLLVGSFDRVGEAWAGHLGHRHTIGELTDQFLLIRASRRGSGRPNRDRVAARRRWLDGGDGADDRQVRLEFGSQQVKRPHRRRVAGEHQNIRRPRQCCLGTSERPLGDVVRGARAPRHALWVHGQDQFRAWAQPAQMHRRGKDTEARIDECESHAPTLAARRASSRRS